MNNLDIDGDDSDDEYDDDEDDDDGLPLLQSRRVRHGRRPRI